MRISNTCTGNTLWSSLKLCIQIPCFWHPLYWHLLILTPYPPPLFNTFHFPDILLLPKFLQAIFTGIALYIIFFKFMLHFVAFPVFLFFFLFQFDLFCTTTLSQNKSMDPLKTCVCANPIYTWFIQCCSQYCIKDDNWNTI